MHLTDLITRYSATAGVGSSPATVRHYMLTVSRFGESLGRVPCVADLTDENFGRFAAHGLAAGRSRHTVSGEQSKLLALWNFAAKLRLVDQFPVVKPIKAPVRVARGWTQDEIRRLWEAAEFASPVGFVPGRWWWRALFAVLFDTAERIGAVMALRWEWIDDQSIYLPAEVRKGGLADKTFTLHAETMRMLLALPRDGCGPFSDRMSVATLYARLKRIHERAGLPTDRRSMFHRWRRTTLSHFAAVGGDAQRLAGHSSPKMTSRYLDERITRPPSPPDLLFRPGA